MGEGVRRGAVESERQRVLIVDDTRLNASILQNILNDDYAVMVAYSGREALEKVEASIPDLILLDIMMPDMDGMEVCRRLKRMQDERSRIPVIFVTSVHDPAVEEAAFALGAVDFVHKPFSAPVVQARVRTHLALAQHAHSLEDQVRTRSAELARAMGELIQSERLATMGSLVAGFTHEINSPIANLRGISESVLSRIASARSAMQSNTLRKSDIEALFRASEQGADLIDANVRRAIDLIESFKLVAVDQTSMRRRHFILRDLIEKTLRAIAPSYMRQPIAIDLQVPADIQMESFPGAIEQIVTNLVINAVRHAGADGEGRTLALQISAERLDPDRCRVSVIDNGVGMSAELAARAFERFFTTKADQGGSGLGLYLVKALVTETLKGEVRMQTAPGKGTAIIMSLPMKLPAR